MLGLVGMIHHFWNTPEPPPADPPLSSNTYKAPRIPQRPVSTNNSARTTEPTPDLRRQLREFIIPLPGIIYQPPADALALLQHFWETLPHETDAVPPASFTLTDSALEQIQSTTPPQTISLEIPGVSLLTHLQLLAAQTGLTLHITNTGALLDLPKRPPSPLIQTSNYQLDPLVVQRFTSRGLRIYEQQSTVPINYFLHKSLEVQATVSKDGTIDLNLDPNLAMEVIDFSDLINYGEPIKTTGINALGQSEPVVLTDSKITKPVFATRVLQSDQIAALEKLFEGMGFPAHQKPMASANGSDPAAATWNAEAATLTTTGPKRTQQIVSQTTAAILESAQSGARIDFAVLDWQDDTPPEAPTTGRRRPATGANVAQESKTKENPSPPLRLRCGVPMSGPMPPVRLTQGFLLPPQNPSATAVVERTGARFTVDLTIEVPGHPDIFFNTDAKPALQATSLPRQLVKLNQWHRVEPAIGSNTDDIPRQSLFIRIKPETIAGE